MLRLIVAASFHRTVAWEIRAIDDELMLVRCESPAPDQYTHQGEKRLSASSAVLRDIVEGFRSFSVPLLPHVASLVVADGTSMELILASDSYSRLILKWGDGHHPSAWEPLEVHVAAVLERLRAEYQ